VWSTHLNAPGLSMCAAAPQVPSMSAQRVTEDGERSVSASGRDVRQAATRQKHRPMFAQFADVVPHRIGLPADGKFSNGPHGQSLPTLFPEPVRQLPGCR
jgi:hypothetical protein